MNTNINILEYNYIINYKLTGFIAGELNKNSGAGVMCLPGPQQLRYG